MEEKEHISQYRNRLDKTLAAHELTDVEALKKLISAQMLSSSKSKFKENENIVDKRTREVFKCVEMLKSTAEYDDADENRDTRQRGWKLKQENEDYRVMYREGPEGTPFHSLLVEGYVDGSLDVCLCVSWELNLYKKWWPQSSIPTFKILACECLQKVGIDEQICLLRTKLSWPLSSREAVIHFFAFEYFQDDLIIVLFNSISNLEDVDGFPKDAVPDKSGLIMIDVLGGMAMQKVSSNRSYFRTISNMDIKLDFVPPSVINFLSRQLIGTGFLLYKKEVASVSRGDEDYSKALKGPLYSRIREALYSNNIEPSIQSKEANDTEPSIQSEEANDKSLDQEVDVGPKNVTEIEEVQEVKLEGNEEIDENENTIHDLAINNNKEKDFFCSNSNNRKVTVSPPVKQAIETLEKCISLFREYKRSDSRTLRPSGSLPKRAIEEQKSSEEGLKGGGSSEVTKDKSLDRASHELGISFGSRSSRRMGSNPSYLRETNHSNRIVPTSPEVNIRHPSEAQLLSLHDALSFHKTGVEATFISDNNNQVDNKQQESTTFANGSHNMTKSKMKHKRWRKFFCLRPRSEQF